jgi:GNAT superfamily N-acetyltransferase
VRATTAHFDEFFHGPPLRRRPKHAPAGEEIELRDGSTCVARPLAPADASLVAGGFEQLSAVNRYRQFLFDRPDLNALTTVDRDHYALGALDPATGAGIGLARYVRDANDPQRAIVGVVVVDSWQGRGLATRLLHRLAAHARDGGIEHFDAHMIVGDDTSQRMFESIGPLMTTHRAAGVVDVTVKLT